jgi:hypothetical protein
MSVFHNNRNASQPAGRRVTRLTGRQKALRELARRENLARIARSGHAILRCEYAAVGDARGPKGLDGTDLSWDQLADLSWEGWKEQRDAAQVIVVDATPDRVPTELLRQTGVELLRPTVGELSDLDRLSPDEQAALLRKKDLDIGALGSFVPVEHPVARGHFSFAHQVEIPGSLDEFSYSQAPLSGHADWSESWSAVQDVIEANGTRASIYRNGGVSNAISTLLANVFVGDMSGYGPDYSVEGYAWYPSYSASDWSSLGPAVRVSGGDAYVWNTLSYVAGRHRMVRVLGGSSTTLSEKKYTPDNQRNRVLQRLEVVGSQLKGYRNGVLLRTPTDTSITDAGSAGIGAYQRNASGCQTAYLDDWHVLVESLGAACGATCTPPVTTREDGYGS